MASISEEASPSVALVAVPQGRTFVSLSISESYYSWFMGIGCTDLPTTCGQNTGTISINELAYNQTFSKTDSAPVAWTDSQPETAECVGGQCQACNDDWVRNSATCLGLTGEEAVECEIHASDALSACLAKAAGDYDSRVKRSRRYWQILPLSDAVTQSGTTLTLNARSTGTGRYSATAILSGDVGFTLTQTDRFFRPRDARDPAAGCDAGNQNNCYTPFALSFDPPNPMGSGGTGALWNGSCTLTLAPPPYQPQWLPGSSTNYTLPAPGKKLPAPDPNAPDYVFEASRNTSDEKQKNRLLAPSSDGLSISTDKFDFNGPGPSWPVTVTSHDYGGMANLRATCKIDNIATPLEATIVDAGTGNYIRTQSGCGKDSAGKDKRDRGNYAAIPVDEDCNGIADSWEQTYAQALLGKDFFPDPSADIDRGALGKDTPPAQLGDGLSVHDEYRGFHVLDPQTGKAKWISTDPGRQNLFYWDADHIGRTGSDKVGTGVFGSILGATTSGFMDIHPVDALLANGNRAAKNIKEARAINKNTIYPQHKAYAVIYVNRTLEPGKGGKSGVALDQYAYTNAGTPILIDKNQVTTSEGRSKFEPGTLLGQTIAHETGHKLSRVHPLRCADTPVPYDPSQAKSLTINQFMQNRAHLVDLYARYSLYSFNGTHKRETALPGGYYNITESSETPLPGTVIRPTGRTRLSPNQLKAGNPSCPHLRSFQFKPRKA